MVLIPDLNTKSGIVVLLKVKIIHNEKEIRILCPKKMFFLKLPLWIIATC